MREVELIYVEVMNETEQLFIFTATFNKEQYANTLILNTALPITVQDLEIIEVVESLATLTRKTAKKASGE